MKNPGHFCLEINKRVFESLSYNFVTCLRLLDTKAENADWKDVAQIVLHRAPLAEELRTRRCWESHLDRAQWLSRGSYKRILKQAAAEKS